MTKKNAEHIQLYPGIKKRKTKETGDHVSKISQTWTKSCFLSHTESIYIYIIYMYTHTYIWQNGRVERTIGEKKGFKWRTREDIGCPIAFCYCVKTP